MRVPRPDEEASTEVREDGLVLLMPVYDDWDAVEGLLPLLDARLAEAGRRARVVLIDDGSPVACPAALCDCRFRALERVDVLVLRRNLGHQRALAVGLSHVASEVPCGAVVVMDADGQDAPEDVLRLVERMESGGGERVVFAARERRSESASFRFFYGLYRLVHLLLTGLGVRVGNFSVVPRRQLERLVVVSNLWSHYAAAVHEARIPLETIPTRRAPRLRGESKMSLVPLAMHGLGAIAVFAPRIGVRVLITTTLLFVLTLAALTAILTLKTTTDLGIPAWTTWTVGVLVLVLVQMLMLSALFVFLILANRDSVGFLPLRDHRYFVADVRTVCPRG